MLTAAFAARDLFLARQAERYGVGEQAELLEIHRVVCWEHRLHGLFVGDTDDDFGPRSLRDVRHGCLFLGRIGRSMSEAGVRNPLVPQ